MLRYRIQGEGPPLLLVHGWGATYSAWDKLAPLLARHFTLIIVDLMELASYDTTPAPQTYYEAAADALEALRESLGVTRWSVFSYSVGTRVGAAYVRTYPQRVKRAIYLCPIRTHLFYVGVSHAARWIHRRDTRPLTWVLSGWRLRLAIHICAFNLARMAYVPIWTEDIERQPVERLKRLLLEIPERGRAPYPLPGDPPIPQLFVWARRDMISTSPAHPQAHDIALPLTHAAPISAPYTVAAAILPFLLADQASSQTDPEASLDELATFEREEA